MKFLMGLYFVLMCMTLGCSSKSNDIVLLSNVALGKKVTTTFSKKDECWASWSKVTNIKRDGVGLSGDVSFPASFARYSDLEDRTEEAVDSTEKCNSVANEQKAKLTPAKFSEMATYWVAMNSETGFIKRIPATQPSKK